MDKQTGKRVRLTVIGILKDTAPLEMVGISTSEKPSRRHSRVGSSRRSTTSSSRQGVDPDDAAAGLEAAFLASGLEAESIQQVVDDTLAANVTFNRLIQGFMGLGLLVGVAALGVISARAVVEGMADRRHARNRIPDANGAGRVPARVVLHRSHLDRRRNRSRPALAWNIIRDTRSQPSWENLELVVPWLNLGVIFLVVYVVALAATLHLHSARRASRPTEALRYQ